MTKQLAEIPAYMQTLDNGVEYLLSRQHEEGYWWGPLLSNVTMEAEYVLLCHCLGKVDKGRLEKIKTYLLHEQREDGTWAQYPGGPQDLDTTIEAYVALKYIGLSPDDERMQKALAFIQSQGGIESARVFTRLWLAVVGEYPWRKLPVVPPEIMFLGKNMPLNIYDFGSWARPTIVALTIVMSRRAVFPLPAHAKVPELFETNVPPRRRAAKGGNSSLFLSIDKLLQGYQNGSFHPFRKAAEQRAIEWLIEHQAGDGSWGGIQPPWFYALLALKVMNMTNHPAFIKGWEGLELYGLELEYGGWMFQASISPVWDTGLSILALRAAGLAPDEPALVKAGKWLLDHRIATKGDWAVRRPNAKPGGWAFQFDNPHYPDVDDTAVVVWALNGLKLPNEAERRDAMTAGFRWLTAMQSSNGGWGAYDVDNNKELPNRIPFCDFGEVIDPPSEDVTAHVLECFGSFGYDEAWKVVARAVNYLKREQKPDGSWYGRWGVNYIYGIGAVVPALKSVGVDMKEPFVQKALDWLVAHQNEDGGWGEDCRSYVDERFAGVGPSTPSQTAWALMALIAGGRVQADAVSRGVAYLVRTQRSDGGWDEPYYTGTGFPGDFYLGYTLYRHIFPVMALGRYKDALGRLTR
ncbi:squalene-hopene cyclase [Alicyclobacillus hesperidum]|uniref:Squalene-hopene cyclase n=1 Tax=Alicyclobacillus hesperidum TaxID=89784 RepID=A0A1H2R2P0_9BACL|nr:squalene--hopene cyclase [Alicyclobacillus hesperidum]GLV13213.1 squalene-hopene cyclase [Alicyclobacillus hesperidum]SDW13478.1 squalene-hopene/tetraprenyl-beta-curcumene cyclase [Alicyclobacillus hesperidum]